MSRDENDDFTKRVNELLGKDREDTKSDKELAEKFNKAFTNDYSLPAHFNEQDISNEIEKMLYESDEEEDAIDDYIYDMLNEKSNASSQLKQGPVQHKMKQLEKSLLGTDESDLLILRAMEENELDEKYDKFAAKRDAELEERLKRVQNYVPLDSKCTNSDKPKGSVPKAILSEDLYDETDDWCCVCNEDATIECDGCEDDNKFCKECFFQTHRSEFADYEATQHKSRKYQKRRS